MIMILNYINLTTFSFPFQFSQMRIIFICIFSVIYPFFSCYCQRFSV